MTTKKKLLQAAAGNAAGNYKVGEYYPIFALKIVDGSSDGSIIFSTGATGVTEDYMRAALSLDSAPSYSSNHDYSDSLSSILSAASSNGVSVNADFGSGGLNVNAYRMDYHATTSTTVSVTAGFETQNSHNFYDDISNQQSNLYPTKTPSSVGVISNVKVGTSGYDSGNVLINASGHQTREGGDFWSTDGSDYCFMGVFTSMSSYTAGTDNLDVAANNIGIAIGISDSDGTPSSGQPPRLGISRRSSGYKSLVTVSGYAGAMHSGTTTSGYIVLYGRVS